MSNLNLTTGGAEVEKRRGGSLGTATVIPILILILVLVAYGAIIYLGTRVDAEKQTVTAQYENEYAKFLAGNAGAVLDYGQRSVLAGKLADENQLTSEIFQEVEKAVLPSVYLDSFEVDREKNTVILTCVGGNFNTVAKQIMSFKQSEYFSSVEPGQSLVDAATNKLNFVINLKTK